MGARVSPTTLLLGALERPLGKHTIEAIFTDMAGNSGRDSVTITIKAIDRPPPPPQPQQQPTTVDIVQPLDRGTVAAGKETEVLARVRGSARVLHVQLEVDGNVRTTLEPTRARYYAGQMTFGAGHHRLVARVKDETGNITESPAITVRAVDPTPDEPEPEDPPPGSQPRDRDDDDVDDGRRPQSPPDEEPPPQRTTAG